MKWLIFPAAALVIPLLAISLKVGNAFSAFLFIENTGWENFTHRLNAGINSDFWHHLECHAVNLPVDFIPFTGKFSAGFGVSTEFTIIDVVRPPVLTVLITPILQHLHVVPQAFTRVFVVVDDMELFANLANEPDRRGVTHTDIQNVCTGRCELSGIWPILLLV